MCYTEKATPAKHRPERQYNACANRGKQCSPNETKSYSNPTPPRKRQNNPTNSHTPRRMKPTHTRLTYTRMRPHAGDHPVPVHTERHNPSKVWTQRQSGLPLRAVTSQGQRHRCRSSRKQAFVRVYRVGVRFGFFRFALLLADGICMVLSFEAMPGLCCFLRVTQS